jgi:hypothetical protein
MLPTTSAKPWFSSSTIKTLLKACVVGVGDGEGLGVGVVVGVGDGEGVGDDVSVGLGLGVDLRLRAKASLDAKLSRTARKIPLATKLVGLASHLVCLVVPCMGCTLTGLSSTTSVISELPRLSVVIGLTVPTDSKVGIVINAASRAELQVDIISPRRCD